jgi:hypothetical protein
MSGYMAAAQSSSPIGALTQAIAATQLGQTNAEMTADQYGQLGLDTQNAVNASMASGKSLSQAMTDVGVAQGVPTTAIAAIAANFNTQDPIGQLAANLGVAPDPQAAAQAAAQKGLLNFSESERRRLVSQVTHPTAVMLPTVLGMLLLIVAEEG